MWGNLKCTVTMRHIQGPLLFSPACYVQWTCSCKNSSGCTVSIKYLQYCTHIKADRRTQMHHTSLTMKLFYNNCIKIETLKENIFFWITALGGKSEGRKILFHTVFYLGKQNFQHHYSSLPCHVILQKYNMLIWCINYLLLSMLKTVMLLNIFVETGIHFPHRFCDV